MGIKKSCLTLIIGLFLLSFWSCQDANDIKLDLNIERFDSTLMAVKSKQEMAALLVKNPEYCKALYRTFPDDTAFVSHVYYICTHPATRALYDETKASFGNLNELKTELESAFKNIKLHYPNFKAPKVISTFTGLESDMYVSDSLIIISLEHFIGPKATYRPQQPNYILQRYTKNDIVPSVIKFLANSYNKNNIKDETFLADMMYFGKSLEFTKTMLPNTPDSLIVGYKEQEMYDTHEAQDLIWAHVIDKGLLYNQNTLIKEKYFGESPAVTEIGPKCPGRIGQWLGWQIIKKYRKENPKVDIVSLMAETRAEELLKLSQYRGEIEKE